MTLWMLWGCAPSEPEPEPEPAPALPRCVGPYGARVDECAGFFSLPLAEGGTVSSEDALGQVAVVHVASALSELDPGASQLLSELYVQRADFWALDVLAQGAPAQQDALDWQSALALAHPVAWDESEQFGRDWADTGLYPTLLVLDATGKILARMHEQYEQQLPAALDAALLSR